MRGNVVLMNQAVFERLLFLPFRHQHQNTALPFPPGSPHPLHHANGRFARYIEADDEVNFPNVQPFFADASGEQSVAFALLKVPDDPELGLLRHPRSLPQKRSRLDKGPGLKQQNVRFHH